MGYLDLHIHSICSDDGEFSPEALVERCIKTGVRVAAIADHNTTRGVAQAQAAARPGITIIPAVELDCVFENVSLHLLGYGIDPNYPKFDLIERELIICEQEASSERLALAREIGLHIDDAAISALARNGVITGEMLAEAALDDPSNDDLELLKPYREGGAREGNAFVNFYWDYCSQGKPLYVPVAYMSLAEAVALIGEAGGAPILAHPGNNVHEDAELLRRIIQQGVCGMEVYSSYHTPEQTAFYHALALEGDLIETCGSDYHGKVKPRIETGSIDCAGNEDQLVSRLTKKLRAARQEIGAELG